MLCGQTVLEQARQQEAAAGDSGGRSNNIDNIVWQEASAYELPFDDGAFDVVFAHQVGLQVPIQSLPTQRTVIGGIASAAGSPGTATPCCWSRTS